jgi:3',5'-cyclic AMP phosphodiesterase CpdA
VLGNHDFSVTEDKIDHVAERLNRKEKDSAALCRTGPEGTSHERLPTPFPNRYFAWCIHGWRFVVLDGNDLSLFGRRRGSCEYQQAERLYTSLKTRNAPNAQTWNGGIGRAQLCWLEGQLAQADRAGQKVVVFCHYPVFPENSHNLWNDQEVLRVLESHPCVTAYLNGHNHAGNYAQRCGIHYVTLPGMVETPDTTAYAVVRTQPTDLELIGYGRTPSRQLAYRS